jgi:hypothetical protein
VAPRWSQPKGLLQICNLPLRSLVWQRPAPSRKRSNRWLRFESDRQHSVKSAAEAGRMMQSTRLRFGGAMTTRRPRTGNLLAMRAEIREKIDKYPAARFPVQHEIQQLQKELNDFNERIIELESEGHSGHAMEVLKAKAIDFARQIDELRCLLVRSQR